MKKVERKIVGLLIVMIIIAYPFVWLQQKIGSAAIISLGIILFCAAILWIFHSSKKDKAEFNKLVLYVLHNRLPPDEARKINYSLSKTNFPRSALIRCLQILRDSIDISLSSKKRETAEYRMEQVKSCHSEIKKHYGNLINSESMAEIDRVVSEWEHQFNTNLYANIAQSHLDKAESLKTPKSKAKYATLAMEAITEGIQNPKSEKGTLEELQKKIEHFMRFLEKSPRKEDQL